MTNAHAVQLHRTAGSDPSEARRLQRLARAGTLQRVRRGVFAEPDQLAALDARGRHVVLVRAALPLVPSAASLSHLSAVAVGDWPHIGEWPDRVHVTTSADRSTLYRDGMTVHRGVADARSPEQRFEGVPVQHPAVVAVELARTLQEHQAIVLLDHALRTGHATAEQFAEHLALLGAAGRARAAAAVAGASRARESVGESFCAARLRQVQAPTTEEQHVFRHPDGTVDRVDFWFAELGIVLEFDGREKYENTTMLGGATPRDVLWAEKGREDRIRALPEVRGFIRVRWWHLAEPDRLRALLRQHGVPCR